MATKPPRRAIAIGATAMSMVRTIESVSVGEGFAANVNGLTVIGTPPLDAWREIGRRLRVMERGAQFALGDFIVQLEGRFSEEASDVIDASEWSLKTCAVYRWLASSIVADDRRMDRLTVAHHLLVAALPRVKQKFWLAKAADDENDEPWTVARLKAALKAGADLRPSAWWVLVACKDEKDQRKLLDQMEKAGRTCKAVTRRTRATKGRRR